MSSLNKHFFGVKLWLFLVILIALFLIFFGLSLLFVYIIMHIIHGKKFRVCRLTSVISASNCRMARSSTSVSMNRRLLSFNKSDIEMGSFETVESGSHWFTMREIQDAKSLIGLGANGVVYRGVLTDDTPVVVKKLLYQSISEEEVEREVEKIQRLNHKNLVKMLGFCIDSSHWIVANEYVAYGSLHQWLHGYAGNISPLTWSMRLVIISGVAKGLAYLHEDIEPKMVHNGIKSTNILMAYQWEPKISDVGFAKAEFGYKAPETAKMSIVTEKADVYSFGILVVEIISGKSPVNHDRSPEEGYLIKWLKSMVLNQNFVEVLDPEVPEAPPLTELKRILLIALRCVHADPDGRPTMGEVIHMLEPRDLLLCQND